MAKGLPVDMSGAQFATLNSLRTGNMILDMVLAMMVPLFFNVILGDGARDKALKIWYAIFGTARDKSPCVRSIAYYVSLRESNSPSSDPSRPAHRPTRIGRLTVRLSLAVPP